MKTYLQYKQDKTFGIILSNPGCIIEVPNSKEKYIFAVSGQEDVLLWDIRKGKQIKRQNDSENYSRITCMKQNPKKENELAVGYEDGKIRIWNIDTEEIVMIQNAHNTSITVIEYNTDGSILASGGIDTDIVVWDIIGQCGLYRLRGHRSDITDIHFQNINVITSSISQAQDIEQIVSSSKDSTIRIWDTETQNCITTLTCNSGELQSFDFQYRKIDKYVLLVCGSTDAMLRIWKISTEQNLQYDSMDVLSSYNTDSKYNDTSSIYYGSYLEKKCIEYVGVQERIGGKKRVNRQYFYNQSLLIVQGNDKVLDLYNVRTIKERNKRQSRRQRRNRLKQSMQLDTVTIVDEDKTNENNTLINKDSNTVSLPYIPSDDLEQCVPQHIYDVSVVDSIVQNIEYVQDTKDTIIEQQCGQNNNSIVVWKYGQKGYTDVLNTKYEQNNITDNNKKNKLKQDKTWEIEVMGHRKYIRNIELSNDNSQQITNSENEIKQWNIHTYNCIRTIYLKKNNNEKDKILCTILVPGNEYIVYCTYKGHIIVIEISTGNCVQDIISHNGKPIWCIKNDIIGKYCSTGGDTEIIEWEYVCEINNINNKKVQRQIESRKQKQKDQITSQCYSKDNKIIAIGQLDTTIQQYILKNYQYYLTQYGHKQPITCQSIQYDSTMQISGSDDKSIRIWGQDYGDCRRVLYGHSDGITDICTIPNTHYFFSASKDHSIIYWDGDKGIDIQKLQRHHREQSCIKVSNTGSFVISCSSDGSIRSWQQLKEPLYYEEEKEKRLEKDLMKDSIILDNVNSDYNSSLSSGVNEKNKNLHAVVPWKDIVLKNDSTLQFSENLQEALDICEIEIENWRRYHEQIKSQKYKLHTKEDINKIPQPISHPSLGILTPSQYILKILRTISLSDIMEVQQTLPFDTVILQQRYQCKNIEDGNEIEYCIKCVQFLLQLHHYQQQGTNIYKNLLLRLRKCIHKRQLHMKDTIGMVVETSNYLQKKVEDDKNASIFGTSNNMLKDLKFKTVPHIKRPKKKLRVG